MKDLHFYNPAAAVWLLRLGLGFVFLYAGVSSLQHPLVWVGFIPNALTHAVAATTALKILAVAQLLLAAWLCSGKWTRYAAVVAVLMLAGIVVANMANLITTFRDVGLAAAAVALFFLEKP
ncbi:MAG TPA: MauE/DoxX family redox-associated membrane protein [Candidatus Saccharimonadales bacterium]|nr:MauE/DoxX family redox-associated membrane protein [Candidatus Saccharimonadales bacterium]